MLAPSPRERFPTKQTVVKFQCTTAAVLVGCAKRYQYSSALHWLLAVPGPLFLVARYPPHLSVDPVFYFFCFSSLSFLASGGCGGERRRWLGPVNFVIQGFSLRPPLSHTCPSCPPSFPPRRPDDLSCLTAILFLDRILVSNHSYPKYAKREKKVKCRAAWVLCWGRNRLGCPW